MIERNQNRSNNDHEIDSPRDFSILKTSRQKGLKMVSKSKFCLEFERHFLVVGLYPFRHPRGVIMLPYIVLQICPKYNILPKCPCLCTK